MLSTISSVRWLSSRLGSLGSALPFLIESRSSFVCSLADEAIKKFQAVFPPPPPHRFSLLFVWAVIRLLDMVIEDDDWRLPNATAASPRKASAIGLLSPWLIGTMGAGACGVGF